MGAAMLMVFAENENRDPYIDPETGDQAVLFGAPAVAQLCKSRVEAQRNEMKYAADQGMPTFQTAFNTFNPQQFEAAARTIILATTDVTGIESFSMYQDGNTLYYTAVITSVYDQVTITGIANQ
jgi:hypothetical protein